MNAADLLRYSACSSRRPRLALSMPAPRWAQLGFEERQRWSRIGDVLGRLRSARRGLRASTARLAQPKCRLCTPDHFKAARG